MRVKSLALSIAMIGITSTVAAPIAFADDAVTTAPIEKIEVTGSNIRRVSAETSSPVQTITREQIVRSGAQSVTEVLQNLSSQQGSFSDIGGSNSFAPGASSASLRGLGPQATLVLINGRRLSQYGFPVGAQTPFVDIDTIPMSIVDRIDVLKDGASAIYGSEAMAGVINIITRKDYQGVDLAGSHTSSLTYHDGSVDRGSITGGYGDLSKDKFNVYGTFDVYSRARVGIFDRASEIHPEYPQYFGVTGGGASTYTPWGNLYDANTGAYLGSAQPCPASNNLDAVGHVQPVGTPGSRCRIVPDSYVDLIPKSDRYNLFGGGTWEINENLTAFAEVGYTHKQDTYNGAPQTIGDPSAVFNVNTGAVSMVGLTLQPGSPYNPFSAAADPNGVIMRYRFTDVGPTQIVTKNNDKRIYAGLKGSMGNWDWEASIGHLSSDTDADYHGEIRTSVFMNAIANGTYVFNNRNANSAAFYAALSPTIVDSGNTSSNLFSLKTDNPALFQLPGGDAGIAVGLEHRTESYSTTPDPLIAASDILNYGANSASGSRGVSSIYSELSLPVIKKVELSLAARADHYGDYGTSVTPKFGIKWEALKTLALRATYAEGFRAPSLVEISKSSSSAFYTLPDPARCPVTQADADCNATLPVLTVANPKLQPEKSKSYTAGFVFEPFKNLSLLTDYYNIKRRNEIQSLDPNYVLANASLFPGLITRGPNLPTDPAGIPGPLQYMETQYANLGHTNTSGVDVEATYRQSLGNLGKLGLRANGTYVISLKSAPTPTAPLIENIGTYDSPRFRGGITTSWDYKAFSTDFTVNYVSGYGAQQNNTASCPTPSRPDLCYVASWTTEDLGFSYSGIKNLNLHLIFKNVFNNKSPIDVGALGNGALYNTDLHNIDGRVLSVSAEYSFK